MNVTNRRTTTNAQRVAITPPFYSVNFINTHLTSYINFLTGIYYYCYYYYCIDLSVCFLLAFPNPTDQQLRNNYEIPTMKPAIRQLSQANLEHLIVYLRSTLAQYTIDGTNMGMELTNNTDLCGTILPGFLDAPAGFDYTIGRLISLYQRIEDPQRIHLYQKLFPALRQAVKVASATFSYRRLFLELLLKYCQDIIIERERDAIRGLGNLIPPVLIPDPAIIPAAIHQHHHVHIPIQHHAHIPAPIHQHHHAHIPAAIDQHHAHIPAAIDQHHAHTPEAIQSPAHTPIPSPAHTPEAIQSPAHNRDAIQQSPPHNGQQTNGRTNGQQNE
jgi:hypothetical protein